MKQFCLFSFAFWALGCADVGHDSAKGAEPPATPESPSADAAAAAAPGADTAGPAAPSPPCAADAGAPIADSAPERTGPAPPRMDADLAGTVRCGPPPYHVMRFGARNPMA